MRKILLMLSGAALVAGLMPAAAVASGHTPYSVVEASLPFAAVPGHEDSTRMWGVHKGAGYRIEVPADWNGDLVMWAHGFRGTGFELFFNPEEVPFREYLLENGFAWAASTYTKNDYNVGDGVKDTRRTKKLFGKLVSNPERTYIAGVSMGGHITAASIEIYPNLYDGALPACGVVGDFELFDFFLDFNAAAQQLGVGASAFPVADPIAYLFGTVPAIKAAMEASAGSWPDVAGNPLGEGFQQLVELRSGGDRPNFEEAWFFWNSFPEFGSGVPGNFLFDLGVGDGTLPGRAGVVVDNMDAVYQLDLDPALNAEEIALNADIVRVEHKANARKRKGAKNVPAITGKISVPVLTMHNLGDLFVPFHNEIAYAADVAARGNGDLLVQRAIRGVGHCGFTTIEWETAFADLVAWVEDGIKPLGDPVLDPAAVADPAYGCTFTDFATPGGHLLPAPCP